MSQERRADEKQANAWAEHTVVANLPRLFAGARAGHAPFSEASETRTLIGFGKPPPPPPELEPVPFASAEEPRTVVGRAPTRASAQQLLARYSALASAPPADASSPGLALPLQPSWLQRVASFARDDFRRAPRIVRLLLPALPLVAAATTFLDVDPGAPALSGNSALASTSVAALPAATSASVPPVETLPAGAVAIARRLGHTLASDAADAAARGDRLQAIALYAQLAREQPNEPAFASASRILLRDDARNRPHSGR